MRKEFSTWIHSTMAQQEKAVFLTGDLGFGAFEHLSKSFNSRFLNMGVAEQNMMSVAASLAHEGLIPFCYSIAPFAVFRPAEQIRLDICLHNKNVKIVGNGGGYGYGIMGASHHSIEDIACLTSFQNLIAFIPYCNEDVQAVADAMMIHLGPAYLRLGHGTKPAQLRDSHYAPVRKLEDGNDFTLVGMGPAIIDAILAARKVGLSVDTFVVSEIPFFHIPENLAESIKRTKKVLVVEEHTDRGGLGEHLAIKLLKNRIFPQEFKHRYALGYPTKKYGSQKFHKIESGLDADSIAKELTCWKL